MKSEAPQHFLKSFSHSGRVSKALERASTPEPFEVKAANEAKESISRIIQIG